MPTAPRPSCSDCPKQSLPGSRHCAAHQDNNQALDNSRTSDAERLRNDPLRALYSQARWRSTRASVLQRDPLCMVCGNHASTIVDHVIPAHLWVEQHGGDIESFYREDNLQGLCKKDHDAKSRRETKGKGWHAA